LAAQIVDFKVWGNSGTSKCDSHLSRLNSRRFCDGGNLGINWFNNRTSDLSVQKLVVYDRNEFSNLLLDLSYYQNSFIVRHFIFNYSRIQ
jgi:hypothetical protein